MPVPVRVLIVEDQPPDIELMLFELRRADFAPTWQRAENQAEFLAGLDAAPDVILADHNLPHFDSLSALRLLNERGLDIPLIIVSGSIGDDKAVAAMKQGAVDYVLKDRLTRLGPAVLRALEQKRLRQAKRRADQDMRDSELRFRSLIEKSSDVVSLVSSHGTTLYVSQSLQTVLNYSPEELIGHNAFELVHVADRPAVQSLFSQLLQTAGQSATIQLRVRHKNNGWRWIESTYSNFLAEPSVRAVVVNYHDMTERKQAEAALRQSQTRHAAILESALDAIITIDHEAKIVEFNPAAEKMFGYTRTEVSGKDMAEFIIPPALRRQHHQGLAHYLVSGEGRMIGKQIEITAMRADGSEFPVELAIARINVDGPPMFTGYIRDISERKQAELEVQRRADEFAALYETTRDLAGEQDLATLLQTIIERAAQLLAVSSGAIYLYDPVHGDLELAFGQGTSASPGSRLPLGEGAAGRVAQTRQPLVVNDYTTWEGRSAQYSAIPLRAVISVPMLYGGELIGALSLSELEETRKFTNAEVRLLSLFAGQAASAVHHARMLEQAHQRADRLQTINQISQYITTTLELGSLLRQIVIAVRAAFELYYVAIALIEGDEIVFGAGDSADHVNPADMTNARLKIGAEGISGWVAATGVTCLAADVSTEPRYHPIAALPQIKSELVVPLKTQNGVIGVLDTASDQLNAFSPEHVSLIESLGAQIAGAIQNSRLYEETRQRLAELEAVNIVSTAMRAAPTLDEMLPRLLDETLSMLGTDAGSIWLYDATRAQLYEAVSRGWYLQRKTMPSIEPGEGMRGYVFQSGQPYVSRDFASDAQTREVMRSQLPAGWGGAIIPIRSVQQVIGILQVSVQLPRELLPGEVRLLTTLSEIAGNAIQRTKLYEQTERRLQHLSALTEIDRAISSSFDLHVSLATLLSHVIAQLGINAADVLLFNSSSQTLEIAVGRGFRSQAIERTRLRSGEGYARRAVTERRIVHIPNLNELSSDFTHAILLAGEDFISYYGVPLVAKGQIKGVLEIFHRAPLAPDQEWLDFLSALAERAAIAIDNATLFDSLQRSNSELALAYDATIEGWSRALDLRDRETEGHTQRVADTTVRLARTFGLSEEELVHVRRGALLHDIGKMGVPDGILLKPGTLTDTEWVVMRMHPRLAYEMLSPIHYLRSALDIPYCHHERWDGSGYPRGLKGEQIPLTARIFAVVDVLDALSCDRPYRAAWPADRVREYIRSSAGTHFDPQVVKICFESDVFLSHKRG